MYSPFPPQAGPPSQNAPKGPTNGVVRQPNGQVGMFGQSELSDPSQVYQKLQAMYPNMSQEEMMSLASRAQGGHGGGAGGQHSQVTFGDRKQALQRNFLQGHDSAWNFAG